MKRAAPWEQSHAISSDDSSSSDSEDDAKRKKDGKFKPPTSSKGAVVEVGMPRKKKPGGVDFDALSRHGYRGGPSVLKVPPPKIEPDWSWSTGKERDAKNDPVEESDEERDAVIEGLQGNIPPRSKIEKDENLSFSQKEKRKRDLGQASRGKNYVEEEKRLLRESGVYSGFDS